jgi:hypothetical protein
LDTTEAQSVVLKLSERRRMGGTVGMCEKEGVKRHTLLSTALLDRDVTGQSEAGETRSTCLSAPEESMRRQPRLGRGHTSLSRQRDFPIRGSFHAMTELGITLQ